MGTNLASRLRVEASVLLIDTAIRLMESIWTRARHVYLDEPIPGFIRLAPLEQLFASLGVQHPVLADVIRPLDYDGVESSLVIQSRHFTMPSSEPEGAGETGSDSPHRGYETGTSGL